MIRQKKTINNMILKNNCEQKFRFKSHVTKMIRKMFFFGNLQLSDPPN